jgi:predicted nucleic acid-binding protein
VKVVLDTSVLVSAFIKPNSLPGLVVHTGIAGRYDPCLSLNILAETARILRDKSRLRERYRYTDKDVIRYVEDLLAVAAVVTELPPLSPVSRDPDGFIWRNSLRLFRPTTLL